MLSIIIPARNEAENLKDILDYFSNKSLPINFEVLLINDFSNDDTLIKAQTLFASKKNFKVIDNNKKGLGGAINLGIKKASGNKKIGFV